MKNRSLVLILVVALLGVAFFNFCRQTMMPMMHDQSMPMNLMMDCVNNPANCPLNIQDHQVSFFSLFPAMASRVMFGVFFAILIFGCISRWRISTEPFFLKQFFQRFSIFIASPVLLLAFRRGVLHPKIY